MNTKFKYFLSVIFLIITIAITQSQAQSKIIAEQSFDVKKGELLRIEAEGSDVNIKNWDNNKVDVKVFGNRKAEDNLEIDIRKTSDGVEVIVERKGGGFFSGWFSSMSSKIEIKIPHEFDVYVKTSGGDIDVDRVSGKIDLKTSGGDVNTVETVGELRIHTSGGDVIVGNQTGASKLTTSGGDIKGRSLKGDVEASTNGGDVELTINAGKVEASTSGGDVSVEFLGENKGIDLRTSGGDVNLRVPKNLKGDLYLYSSGGRVRCDLDATKVFTESKRKFEGEVNGGGDRIHCKTSGGDVEVRY